MFRLWSLSTSLSSSPTSSAKFTEAVRKASHLLSKARSVLVVTGAGISAESGLPTYRGVSGLYNDNDTVEDGMTIEECLSGATYRRRPDLTWKHLLRIEKACRGAQPSRAHYLVAKLEEHISPGPVTVMTQNVDMLHTNAGSTDVLCLHGELYKLKCTGKCQCTFTVESYADLETSDVFLPRCTNCGGAIRPSVVLFDEYLGDRTVQVYEEKLGDPMAELMWTMTPTINNYDVSIAIGTSALFQYVNAAALSGRHTIEINPVETPLSKRVDVRIEGGATEALQAIFEELGWETQLTKASNR